MSPRKVLIDVISAFFEYRLRTKSCLLPKISSEKYYLNSVGVYAKLLYKDRFVIIY
jgi:hypothetical protein